MAYCGQKPAPWIGRTLLLAGICNMSAAALAGFFSRPLYPLVVLYAVLGLGFLIAAIDAFRHWPVVFLGLIGKLATFTWIGWDVYKGVFSTVSWRLLGFNDGIWLVPLAAILHTAHASDIDRRRFLSPDVVRIALRKKTQLGISLDEISRVSPALVVLLRHSGCLFCREALADLQVRRRQIEGEQAQLVLVHMGTEAEDARLFARYGLADIPRISDPERSLYRAFGLGRAAVFDLFGPHMWWRAFHALLAGGHRVGKLSGDVLQLPGAFLVFHGEIVRGFRHQYVADRPDYLSLVTGRDYAAPELRES